MTRYRTNSTTRAGISALTAAATALAIALASPAHAAGNKPEWDQVANIKEAAEHIGRVQSASGASRAVEFIMACYKTHSLASNYSRPYEACIAQDYILTQALVSIYSRIPAQELAKQGAPQPQEMAAAMGQRITSAFAQYDVTPKEALELKSSSTSTGFPCSKKSRVPQRRARRTKAGMQPKTFEIRIEGQVG